MTKEQQQETETLNQEVKYYEGIMKGLFISKVLLSEGKMTNHNIEVEMDRYSTELMHRYQVQDALSCISDPPTALDLIAAEREKQISKGYTVEHDQEFYPYGGLTEIAFNLVNVHPEHAAEHCPQNWNIDYWLKLCSLDYKDRVRIAATWMARELERLLHLENKDQ